jgi:hypothetical protein
VSISKIRKSRAETPPIVLKSRRAQRRSVKAAMLHGHPLGVNASNLPRRQFLRLAAGAASLPAVSRDASAQSYPSRPVTMIVPAPAGGATDVVGRVIAERMRKYLGQPVIVENVSGADGRIGVDRAVRARPDGYTIDLGNNGTHILNGALYSLPYDVLNDFAPIAPLATSTFVLFARKTMPAKDLYELIAWLKANPNRASLGTGSAGARVVTAFFSEGNRDPTHYRAVSRLHARHAGSGRRPDRPVIRGVEWAIAGAGREHKSLRSDQRHAVDVCT